MKLCNCRAGLWSDMRWHTPLRHMKWLWKNEYRMNLTKLFIALENTWLSWQIGDADPAGDTSNYVGARPKQWCLSGLGIGGISAEFKSESVVQVRHVIRSPGQTVVEAENARNTWARRMALREGGSLGNPYMIVDPSPREIWRLAG